MIIVLGIHLDHRRHHIHLYIHLHHHHHYHLHLHHHPHRFHHHHYHLHHRLLHHLHYHLHHVYINLHHHAHVQRMMLSQKAADSKIWQSSIHLGNFPMFIKGGSKIREPKACNGG